VYYATYLQKKPDLVYLLSEQVPYIDSDSKASSDFGQRLEVKNVGDAEAKKITVKIEGQALTSSVKPYLTKDVVESSSTPTAAEHVYPSLPPGGSFQVLLKARSKIGSGNVSVSHESGLAREALSSSSSSNIWLNVFFLLVSAAYAYAGVVDWRASKRNDLVWRQRSIRPTELGALKRPWYWSETQWKEIIFAVAKQRIGEAASGNESRISDSFAYKYLDAQDVFKLSKEQISELTELANQAVVAMYHRGLASAWSSEKVEEVMASSCPRSMLEQRYRAVCEAAIKCWQERFEKQFDPVGTLRRLKSVVRPNFMDAHQWSHFSTTLQRSVFGQLRRDLFESYTLPPKPDEAALALLSPSESKSLVEVHEKLATEHDAKDKLRKLQLQLIDLQGKNVELELKTSRQLTDISVAREHVDAQLALIHDVLSDPTAVDRIEAHNDKFAPGNFANLRRLAEIAHKSPQNI